MAWGSTTPAAIAGLIGVLTNSPDLTGVPIEDGPVVSDASVSEAILIGYSGTSDDATAVEGTLAAEGLAAMPDRELYTIRCAVLVATGDANALPDARTRAYELLSAIGGALAADPTLDGVVMVARLADVTLLQSQTPTGANVTVSFGVFCDAYTTR